MDRGVGMSVSRIQKSEGPQPTCVFKRALINESLKKALERSWAATSNARNGLAGVCEGRVGLDGAGRRFAR